MLAPISQEDSVPYVTISTTPGLSAEKKAELMQRCSDAVVESIGASLKSVRVLLSELAEDAYLHGGQPGTSGIMIVVDLIEGRSQAQKDALIAMLSRAAAEVSGLSEEHHVRVRLVDVPRGNMGLANGLTALTR